MAEFVLPITLFSDIEKVNLDIQRTITLYTKISVGAGIASAIAAIVAIAVVIDIF